MHGILTHILLLGSLVFQTSKDFPDLSLNMPPMANAKADIVEMPRATAYMVGGKDGLRLEDRFDVFDLWRQDSVRVRWRDNDGNLFSISRISRKLPEAGDGETSTRLEWAGRQAANLLGKKDLDALDAAAYLLSPVEVEGRVKPKRSQRQNLAELWRYASTNKNAYVYAFRPRVEKGQPSVWYLSILVSADPQAAEVMEEWLDSVKWIKPETPRNGEAPSTETGLLARDYRRSVINHSDWHFAAASNVVVVDNISLPMRDQFIASLTNSLPRMQEMYRKVLPSALCDDTHVAAIRIFDSREEYLAYVGSEMKWSAALWSPQHRELVLHCPPQGSETLLRTVWHEALHQYLDYACSMIHSPVWFNEGHAMLFENVHFDMDGNMLFDPLEDAVAAIKAAPAEIAEYLPEFLEMDYPDFYAGSHEDRTLKYGIAWSIAYFLQVGAIDVRFQPFKSFRADMLKALVRTRSRSEALKSVLTEDLKEELIDQWLAFWKRF